MKDLRFIDIHLYNSFADDDDYDDDDDDDDDDYDDDDDDDDDDESNIVEFDKVSEYLPSSLRFMRWNGFPFSSLPNTFQAKYLVGLDISFSKIVQLWEDGEGKVLHKLRFLSFNWCSKLQTFDLKLAPNLEQLTIDCCRDFGELEIENSNIVQLWEDGEEKVLHKLRFLSFYRCSKLQTFDLRLAPNLEQLTISECYDFVELHIPADHHSKLKYLHLSHSKLKTLHLGNSSNLEMLRLAGCNDLVELHMPAETPKLEEINLSDSKLRILDLGFTPNLKRLNLENCYDLVEINAPVGYLKKLVFLDLSGCGRFESFVFDKRSQPAETGSLSELHLIAEPTDVCPLHSDNDSPKFLFECYYEEDPASSFGNLEGLISIGLCACTNLERFSRSICNLQGIRKLTLEGSIPEAPKDLNQLGCLEELSLWSTDIRSLPDSICVLKQLKSLEIKSCYLLEMLPEDIGRLECLERLILMGCILLRDIPNSICEMKRLEYLHLPYCILLKKLPEELGHLDCLKELDIEGTDICLLPQSIFRLKGRLHIIGDRWLLDSCGLTTKRRRMSDEDSDNDDDEMVCDL